MPRTDNEIRITPSVLDRLLDYEQDKSREPVSSRAKTLREMKQAVKRDLEWLLNTRCAVNEIPPDLKELNNSLAVYGLPDFSTAGIKSDNDADQKRLRAALKAAITTFEPRLEIVNILVEKAKGNERVMHLRIDARLRVDPVPEPVSFDTMLQLGSGQYSIQGE
jgi:type VI secretion system protein ImpF